MSIVNMIKSSLANLIDLYANKIHLGICWLFC